MLSLYILITNDKKSNDKFESVYLKYKNLMLCRAYDILKDSGLAEDATHNAFMRILRNIDNISDVNSIETRGYVMVILENEAKRVYGKEYKIDTLEFDETEVDNGIEDYIEDKQNVALIKEHICRLSDIYKSVLVLKYFNDLSDNEIADTLSISLTAVRKRLSRGKAILLSCLEESEQK